MVRVLLIATAVCDGKWHIMSAVLLENDPVDRDRQSVKLYFFSAVFLIGRFNEL